MTKTMSFAVVHVTIAFTVVYALTGSLMLGGAIALIEPAVNTLGYHLHEKVWQRIEHKRAQRDAEMISPIIRA
ncbi:DUF2061 domain-containing protein [Halopseudomonas salegens]|uniref:Uncharacterized membrane protein n=1 Tax=Halopseudomonas salegens TaxID=1434072 RepID=A0A1H2FRG1_9GAMM|nr:DUF2061 domain-containing protein [Halopseudomonas salegens]SDU09929.1 Uncharacterized membrane protein [Halopseudomonas salegens]